MTEPDVIYSIEKTSRGADTLRVRTGGREIYLHSKVNPEREAGMLEGRFDPGRYDLLIVLGCGLGYHLLPIRDSLEQYTDVVVVDALPGIEKAIGQNRLTSFLAASERVTIISGQSPADAASLISEKIDMDSIRGISVLEHPASIRAFGGYYSRVKSDVEKLIHVKAGNKATRAAFGPRYVANSLRNVRFIEGARPARALFGAFRGHPAVLAVSGPSLDDDIRMMRDERRRFFIVAVDSALPVLCGSGIAPDLVVSLDPQPYVREHFIGCDSGEIPVVCSLTSHPSVCARPNRFISLNTHPFSQLADEVYGGSIGSVDSATGSVAGDALNLCRACGFSAIGVTGLDFSFSGYATYARGTAYQKRYASFFQDRLTTVEGLNCRYIIGSSGGLKADGKYTRKSFLQYRKTMEDFLRDTGMTVTMLNDRGLSLAGARTSTFVAFIDEFCTAEIFGKGMVSAAMAAFPALSAAPFIRALQGIRHGNLFDDLLEASLGRRATDRQKTTYGSMIARMEIKPVS